MSEERMERKCVARSQQPKAGAPDCKKSSDAAHKPWPRSGKKREGGNSGGRNDGLRRNVPPARGATTSGRPRTNAQRGAISREEGSGLEEAAEAELGSVFVPGSKKQSLNHLLQFVYSPREPVPSRRSGPAPTRVRHTSTLHPHHTELFLQASCQFAMRADGKYAAHLLDPDLPVNWELVQHVVVRSGESCECPVCLCAPVAARVTRCGHVYCWPCALHYADVHTQSVPPCPVCAAPLDVAQLKSASVRRSSAPRGEVHMRLVRRARNSTLVEPVPELERHVDIGDTFPQWEHGVDLPYAKIVTITTQQMSDILQRERAELSQQILDEIDTSELPYLERALDLLRQQETQLARAPAASPAPPPPPLVREPPSPVARLDWFNMSDDQPRPVDANDDTPLHTHVGSECDAVENIEIGVEDVKLCEESTSCLNPDVQEFVLEASQAGPDRRESAPPLLSEADKDKQAKYFYFYQAADGQQVFLHGLCVRLLVASWGGHVAAPRVLRAPLLSVKQFTVTRQSRAHAPCTAHLPLHCPYELVELDLQPPLVTPRALALYAGELEKRARARSREQRLERRRECHAASAARRPTPPPPASLQHFPPSLPDVCPPPPASPPAAPSAAAADAPCAPLSFAKMASTSGAWRTRCPLPPRPASPTAAAPGEHDEASPPPRTLCLSDAIEAALQRPTPPPPHKHKKKNKQTLLLTTSLQRSQ